MYIIRYLWYTQLFKKWQSFQGYRNTVRLKGIFITNTEHEHTWKCNAHLHPLWLGRQHQIERMGKQKREGNWVDDGMHEIIHRGFFLWNSPSACHLPMDHYDCFPAKSRGMKITVIEYFQIYIKQLGTVFLITVVIKYGFFMQQLIRY